MVRNIGMVLNLTVVTINHVSSYFIPPTFNTCIINSIDVVTVTKIKSANINFNNITNSAISPNIITANISGYMICYFMCHGNNIILHKQYVCK